MNRLNRFRDLNRSQKTEIRVSPNSQRLRGHAILAFGKPPFSYFQNVAIGHANTPKNLHQNHVGVVNNFFGTCSHSQ